MTIEETISQLRDLKSDRESFYGVDDEIFRADAQACDIAIAALEKQIPKKPTGIAHWNPLNLAFGYCPVCDTPVDWNVPYCPRCGQALDWSDEK